MPPATDNALQNRLQIFTGTIQAQDNNRNISEQIRPYYISETLLSVASVQFKIWKREATIHPTEFNIKLSRRNDRGCGTYLAFHVSARRKIAHAEAYRSSRSYRRLSPLFQYRQYVMPSTKGRPGHDPDIPMWSFASFAFNS